MDFFLGDVAEIDVGTSTFSLDVMINEAKQRITPDLVQRVQAIYQFDVLEGEWSFSFFYSTSSTGYSINLLSLISRVEWFGLLKSATPPDTIN